MLGRQGERDRACAMDSLVVTSSLVTIALSNRSTLCVRGLTNGPRTENHPRGGNDTGRIPAIYTRLDAQGNRAKALG